MDRSRLEVEGINVLERRKRRRGGDSECDGERLGKKKRSRVAEGGEQ